MSLLDLPNELLTEILRDFDHRTDVLSVALSCRRLRRALPARILEFYEIRVSTIAVWDLWLFLVSSPREAGLVRRLVVGFDPARVPEARRIPRLPSPFDDVPKMPNPYQYDDTWETVRAEEERLWDVFLDGLRTLRNLVSISVSGRKFQGGEASSIWDVVYQCSPRIREVSAMACRDDSADEQLRGLYLDICTCTLNVFSFRDLEVFHCTPCGWDDIPRHASPVDALRELLTTSPSLHTLAVDWPSRMDISTLLSDIQLPSLKSLTLGGTSCTGRAAKRFFARHPHIHTLDIKRCHHSQLDIAGVELPGLRVLQLPADESSGVAYIRAVAAAGAPVEELHWYCYTIWNHVVLHVQDELRALHPTLRLFRYSGYDSFTDQFMQTWCATHLPGVKLDAIELA